MTTGKAIFNINGVQLERIHLVADEGKALTHDGESFWHCVDVDFAGSWHEVDMPIESVASE